MSELVDRLADVERENARRIGRLQGAGVNRVLIAELLESSCLLELARLGTARLDQLSYLQACADVLTQVFTLAGAGIQVAVPGAPGATVWSGEEIESQALAERHRIVVDGTEVGWLFIGRLTAALADPGFFAAAAEMIGRGLGVILESQTLKRSASVASALRVASTLDLDDIETDLRRLVEALANWPGAVAAELFVDHPAVGSPIRVRAGFWDADGIARPLMERAVPGAFVKIRWASDDDRGESEAFDPIVTALSERFTDLTDDLRLRNEVETDPLTGLGNRRRLEYAIDAVIVRARRFNERVAVVMCDLDHFKRVNDTLGHHVGDLVLKATAEVLRATVRGYDIVCRLGGEEFVILCPQTDQVAAMALAERIRQELPLRCASELPEGWRQTVSIGISVFPDHSSEGPELLKSADVALYRAKSAGRDRVMLGIVENVTGGAGDVGAAGATPPKVEAPSKRVGGLSRLFGR